MPSFTLTKRALVDLVEIGSYTHMHWGREQRNIYLTMLDGCFQHPSAPERIRRMQKTRTLDKMMNGRKYEK